MKSLAVVSAIPLVLLGCAASSPPPPSQPQQAPSGEVAVVDLSAPKEAPPPAPKAENPDQAQAQAQADLTKKVQEAGILGVLKAEDGKSLASIFGSDDEDAKGNMWGASVGDSFGVGGLGLSGSGTGGGRGDAIGLGSIGTLGHGAGTGTGQGFGSGTGRLGGSHRGAPPKVVMGATTVAGRLPPEVIQRIVRQNFGRFRYCYEKGLLNNPKLEGMVTVKFIIGKDGAVTSSVNNGSDMPDATTVSCVVKSFSTLSFPSPEGGVVSVVYPIKFSPGADAPVTPTPAPAAPPPSAAPPAPKPAAPPAPPPNP